MRIDKSLLTKYDDKGGHSPGTRHSLDQPLTIRMSLPLGKCFVCLAQLSDGEKVRLSSALPYLSFILHPDNTPVVSYVTCDWQVTPKANTNSNLTKRLIGLIPCASYPGYNH